MNIEFTECLNENTPNDKRIQQYREINSNNQALQCQNELYKLFLNECSEELDEILYTNTNYNKNKTGNIDQITSSIIKNIEQRFEQKNVTTSRKYAENFLREYNNSNSIRDIKKQAEIDSIVIQLRKEWKD